VVDQGPGIRPTTGTASSYRSSGSATPTNTTGVGLGLALSRGLTEVMGGTLDPDETPGGGLTMIISLPAAAGDKAAVAPGQRERDGVELGENTDGAGPGWVDDEPQILRALRINLRVRGYDVDIAATGKQALEVAARHPPDLVLLDLGLPDLDGVDVIGGLRGWSTAPIIVLSGRAESTDKVVALDAGADDYVTKPFGMDELLARMRAAVRRGRAAGRGAAGAPRRPGGRPGRQARHQARRQQDPAHPDRVAPA